MMPPICRSDFQPTSPTPVTLYHCFMSLQSPRPSGRLSTWISQPLHRTRAHSRSISLILIQRSLDQILHIHAIGQVCTAAQPHTRYRECRRPLRVKVRKTLVRGIRAATEGGNVSKERRWVKRKAYASSKVRILFPILWPCTVRASGPLCAGKPPSVGESNSVAFSASSLQDDMESASSQVSYVMDEPKNLEHALHLPHSHNLVLDLLPSLRQVCRALWGFIDTPGCCILVRFGLSDFVVAACA